MVGQRKNFQICEKGVSEVLANPEKKAEQIRTALSEKKIDWKFIVPRAPWWGGFYERLVKSVKLPLKKIFGNVMLDAEQMATVLTEIEAQINSRPLTYVGAEPSDLNALTPPKILIGRKLQAFPGKDTKVTEHTSNALKKRFQNKRVMLILQQD